MDFSNIAAIRSAGFVGFKSFTELRASKCAEVPSLPGVYIVMRDSAAPPEFLATSPVSANTKRKKIPYVVTELQARWVEQTPVVYVGKTGGSGNNATLQKRIRAFIDTGLGGCNHSGGRAVWQLRDCWNLLVCWQAVDGREPREWERELIAEFAHQYRKLPFANMQY